MKIEDAISTAERVAAQFDHDRDHYAAESILALISDHTRLIKREDEIKDKIKKRADTHRRLGNMPAAASLSELLDWLFDTEQS